MTSCNRPSRKLSDFSSGIIQADVNDVTVSLRIRIFCLDRFMTSDANSVPTHEGGSLVDCSKIPDGTCFNVAQ